MNYPDFAHASPNDAQADDPLLPESAAAAVLGGDKPLSVKTMQAWRVAGKGPRFIKLGSGLRSPVRYRRSELMRFLADGVRGSTSEHSVAEAK